MDYANRKLVIRMDLIIHRRRTCTSQVCLPYKIAEWLKIVVVCMRKARCYTKREFRFILPGSCNKINPEADGLYTYISACIVFQFRGLEQNAV